jgi:hypothetical protein
MNSPNRFKHERRTLSKYLYQSGALIRPKQDREVSPNAPPHSPDIGLATEGKQKPDFSKLEKSGAAELRMTNDK